MAWGGWGAPPSLSHHTHQMIPEGIIGDQNSMTTKACFTAEEWELLL
jgi:hypothetical protein